MNKLKCIETYIDKEKNYYSSFIIEPLKAGQGITIGNALRRILLSDITSFTITGVRINNLKHEFSVITGIREDILEMILNLKQIIFKSSLFLTKTTKILKMRGFLNIKGPIIVTAGMFYLPKNLLKIINPNQYICTIITNTELYLEIDIENGIGYQLNEEKLNLTQKTFLMDQNTLYIDTSFNPIKNVNYKIKLINDFNGIIKESLWFEIVTNGSITPKRSLQEAIKILLNLFYPLLFSVNNLKNFD